MLARPGNLQRDYTQTVLIEKKSLPQNLLTFTADKSKKSGACHGDDAASYLMTPQHKVTSAVASKYRKAFQSVSVKCTDLNEILSNRS